MGACFRQRRLLGCIERFDALRPIAPAVFAPPTEHLGEEPGGDFIVLRVGFVGVQGDRPGAHVREQIAKTLMIAVDAQPAAGPQPRPVQATDTGPDQ
jgi:hypothetical protein